MKKKIWIFGTVILLILVYGVILYTMQEVHLNIGQAAKITVFAGASGKTAEVTDAETVRAITDDFNRLTLERGSSSKKYEGCVYELTWFDAEGNAIQSVRVMSADRISSKDRFLLVKQGSDGLHMAVLDELFSEP